MGMTKNALSEIDREMQERTGIVNLADMQLTEIDFWMSVNNGTSYVLIQDVIDQLRPGNKNV
jgi:hypothetical protein